MCVNVSFPFSELYSYTEEPEYSSNQACFEELAKAHGKLSLETCNVFFLFFFLL